LRIQLSDEFYTKSCLDDKKKPDDGIKIHVYQRFKYLLLFLGIAISAK